VVLGHGSGIEDAESKPMPANVKSFIDSQISKPHRECKENSAPLDEKRDALGVLD
jgi:hypothetical protein